MDYVDSVIIISHSKIIDKYCNQILSFKKYNKNNVRLYIS